MTEVTSGGISSADIASARASLRGAFGSGEPEATTTLPATSLTPESRFNLSGIAKATAERLRNIGGGLAYVATHPAMWPGIAWSGAKGWGENMIHPLNVAKQVIVDKKPLTKDELFWVAGAIEGAVETFVVYNSLPPGLARLTRAGASFAFGQAPMLVSYIREIREKGEAAKAGATAEEIKDIEQRHTRAAGFIKSFSRGRAAGGAVRMFTAFGALEILGEKGFEAVGIDPGQVVQKGFSKARGGIVGADQQVLELARVNEALSSDDFRNAANIINSAPDFNQQLVLLDNQTIKEALDGLGLKTENLSDEALEQIKQATITKTNIWSDNHLVEGTREALLADPQLHVGQAVLIGKQHVIDSLQKLKDDPNAYQQFIEERKVIINQALQEEKDRTIVETTPTSTSTATATTTAIATSTPTSTVTSAPVVIPAKAAGAAVTPVQEAAAQQILQSDEVSTKVEATINDFANTRSGHRAVRLITNNIARANGFESWDQVPEGAAKKTLASLEGQLRETYEKEFKQGVVDALAKDPNNIDTALWAGVDKGSEAMNAYMGLPDPPFSAGEELTPDVQKFVDNADSAFRKNLLIDRIIANRPDFQAAKAAAVGARLDVIDQEYSQAVHEMRIDVDKIPTQTLGAIEKRFQTEFQYSIEAKANEYFDAQADTAIRGGQPFEQAATLGSKQFLGDLDNTASQLRKTLHKTALETLTEVTKAEGKATLVGANLDQVDQATNQAIDKLGISGEISAQTRQAIKVSIQHRAEELVDKSFNQAVEAHKDQPAVITDLLADTKDRFQHDLTTTLQQGAIKDAAVQYENAQYWSVIDAQQVEVEKAAKDALSKALADRATTHAVVSSDTYADVQESAKYIVRYQAKQILDPKIAAVKLDDPDPAHLHVAIKQAVAEGKKGLDNQLNTAASNSTMNVLHANAEHALAEHLQRDGDIRDQVAKAVSQVSQDHITAYEVKSGQTVAHILQDAKQSLDYTPHDAKKLAAFIAVNEKELADMHYAFEQAGTLTKDGYFPVTLDSLYDIMIKAENGDVEAMRKLREAVWWIQKGHTLKVISATDQEKIINILRSGRAPSYIDSLRDFRKAA